MLSRTPCSNGSWPDRIEVWDGQRLRRMRVGVLEQDAVGREPVDVRRLRPCVAVGGQAIGSQRVDRDEDDRSGRRGRLSCRPRHERPKLSQRPAARQHDRGDAPAADGGPSSSAATREELPELLDVAAVERRAARSGRTASCRDAPRRRVPRRPASVARLKSASKLRRIELDRRRQWPIASSIRPCCCATTPSPAWARDEPRSFSRARWKARARRRQVRCCR